MIRIALIKSSNQFELVKIEPHKNHGGKNYDMAEIKEKHPQLILFASADHDSEIMGLLAEEYRFIPVRPMEDFSVTLENVGQIDYAHARNIVTKSRESWVIQNNLQLLENLFPTLEHLKQLMPNDRASFMEELWFILRNNLGSEDLVMIYNSLRKAENEKNKLVQSRVAGDRYPETYDGEEFEKKVMEHYQGLFEEQFSIREYSEEKEQLVATISLKGSPLILMAKIGELSRLQQALIKSLFDGLQKL